MCHLGTQPVRAFKYLSHDPIILQMLSVMEKTWILLSEKDEMFQFRVYFMTTGWDHTCQVFMFYPYKVCFSQMKTFKYCVYCDRIIAIFTPRNWLIPIGDVKL